MKRYTLLLVSLVVSVMSYGQSVRGTVIENETQEPIIGALAVLTPRGDTTQKISTVTDIKGEFEFEGIAPGGYLLKIENLGRITTRKRVRMTGENIDLGTIAMQLNAEELKEVTVKGQQVRVEQKGDTTQYNADAFKTNPNATAGDLVKKIPGVTTVNGQVQSNGENVQKVLVDGKPFFGNDPNTALNTLPAEAISKIQVFDDESEQSKQTGFSDGNTQKTLNIITKPGMNKGTFGRFMGGYGYENKYQFTGNYNIFNGDQRITLLAQTNNINIQNFSSEDLLGVSASSGGGGWRRRGSGSASSSTSDFLVPQQGGITTTHAAGINYQDKFGKSTDFVGSYFFNYSDNYSTVLTNRDFFPTGDVKQIYNGRDSLGSVNINHRFNMRFSSKLSKYDKILFTPTFSLQQNDGYTLSEAITAQNGAPVNGLNNNFSSDYNAWNLSGELFYTRTFEKKGRQMLFEFSGGASDQDGNNSQFTLSDYLSNGILVRDTLDQTATLSNPSNNYSTALSWTEPFGKSSSVMLLYRFQESQGANNQLTYQAVTPGGPIAILDTALSNDFDSRFLIHRPELSYRYRLGRKFFAMARVRMKFTELNNEITFPEQDQLTKNFNNVLPSFFTRYAPNENHRIMLGYRTSTDLPTVSQLQNVVNNNNPLQLTTGNPLLDQEYSHRIFTRYNFTSKSKTQQFYGYFSGTFTEGYIANQSYITANDTVINGVDIAPGTQISSPLNLDGYYNLRAIANYSLPINFIQSNLNFNLSGTTSRIPGRVNFEDTETNQQTAGFGVYISSNISEDIDFTVSSQTDWSWVENPNQPLTQYLTQTVGIKLDWIIWDGWAFHNNLNYQFYDGYSESFNNQFTLWNVGIGKYLWEEKAEIKLSIYDLLNQNNAIGQTSTETYIEETQTLALQQYIMLSFTYRLTDFTPTVKEDKSPWKKR